MPAQQTRTRPPAPRTPPDDAPQPARGRRDELARQLWDEHYARLAGWCAARVGDPDLGRDIASEAFTRLLARWVSVRDPRGFLYVAASNLINDRWRHQVRDRKLTARLAVYLPESAPACDLSMRDLVDRLPVRLRESVVLYYYDDLSVAEIATRLQRPQGTIKRRLSDARERLLLWIQQAA